MRVSPPSIPGLSVNHVASYRVSKLFPIIRNPGWDNGAQRSAFREIAERMCLEGILP